MRTAGYTRIGVAVACVVLASCAMTTRPQQFRTFFVPPATHAAPVADGSVIDPPHLGLNLYAGELPSLTIALPTVARPTDTDFLLKKAEDRLAAGKRAFQDGHPDDARREFNQAIEALLTAPENLPDRARVERRLEELVDSIYRFDVEQFAGGDSGDKVTYDKSPKEEILDMTFPVDPGLRSKIKEQIQATVSQLPLEESDAVVGAINFFSTVRGKKILAGGLRRAGRYKALIDRVLAEEGIPQELIFVAQAESGFLPRAVSNKQCVGLWQFAKFRGKEYGLTQTAATDDRMDPVKATRAAAHHLHDLYTHFGDWYLAMAAYDCGPGCVDHAVMRTGYADFWSLRRLNVLPKETANYVPVILAMVIMSKNAKDYGLDDVVLEPPMEFETLELQTPTHLALVADAVDRPLSALRELNPAVIKSVAPAGYELHVPKGSLESVESALAIIPPNRRDSWRLHRVEHSDTLASLAKRYNAPVASLSSANHQELPSAGELMAIPAAYPGERVAVRTKAKHSSSVSSKGAQASARAKTPIRKKSTSAAHKATAKLPPHRPASTRTRAS